MGRRFIQRAAPTISAPATARSRMAGVRAPVMPSSFIESPRAAARQPTTIANTHWNSTVETYSQIRSRAETFVSVIRCRMRARPRHGRNTLKNKKISQKSQGINRCKHASERKCNTASVAQSQSILFYNVQELNEGGSMTDGVKLTSMAKAAG